MIRIRLGESWRHDPALRAALRRAAGPARAAAAQRIVDVLAIEVDGVDIAAGESEGPLLPSLEALLRALARLLSGAPGATVPLRDDEVELVLRRRGSSALLTVVVHGHPTRVVARDVDVELEALAAAALDATAALVGALAEAEPAAPALPGARKLQAAARALRATEPAPPGPAAPRGRRATPRARRAGAISCAVELDDPEHVLAGYAGGRADLASLLAPGRVAIRAGGAVVAELSGAPFLAVRDLARAARAILAAVARGDRAVAVKLAAGRASAVELRLDLSAGGLEVVPAAGGLRDGAARRSPTTGDARAHACPPLDLAAALLGGAAEFVRLARALNPRQGENAHLVELEAAAAEGLAHVAELAGGDVARPAPHGAAARPPRRPAPSQRPLGPGRLRRVVFRRVLRAEVGAPAGEGLVAAGRLVIACGHDGIAALPVAGGAPAWRGPGASWAALAGGTLLVLRDGALEGVAPRSGARRFTRPAPGARVVAAAALARGPALLAHPDAITAIDPGSGRTLWRLAPPGARHVLAAALRDLALVATDAPLLYAVDAAGGTAWRLRLPGAPLFAPVAAGRACVVACATPPGGALLAVEAATGRRLWEAPLHFAPAAPPLAAGGRWVVAGTVGGDPVLAVLDRRGQPLWTDAPPLRGAPAVGAGARGVLFVRDGAGALAALERDGAVRWSVPAPAGHPPPGHLAPRAVRSAVLAAHEGLAVHDAATGALLGVAPHLAPVRLLVGEDLAIAAMDAEGSVSLLRLATHLSVV